MKKLVAVLLVLVMVLTMVAAASAEEVKNLSLARGKQINLWAYPFDDANNLYQDKADVRGVQVKYVKLKGTSGTVKVKSSASWLSAKVKSGKVYMTIKGGNSSNADKIGKVTVTDKKGTFGTIVVRRGGISTFTSVKQVGKTIQLKYKLAESANRAGYIRMTVYDAKGNRVELEDEYITNQKNIDGDSTVYVDDMTRLKAGYTYIYTLGYVPAANNSGNGTSVAVIRISKAKGNATGAVKSFTDMSYNWNDELCLALLK